MISQTTICSFQKVGRSKVKKVPKCCLFFTITEINYLVVDPILQLGVYPFVFIFVILNFLAAFLVPTEREK